jgi:hypothetical protein
MFLSRIIKLNYFIYKTLKIFVLLYYQPKAKAKTTTLISVAKKKHLTKIQRNILIESAARLLKLSVIEIRHLIILVNTLNKT